ncbi:MAG: Tn3 family transposase [Pseudomonadota bacterium]|nr:Tn3 family transposase [Pseudomonadota bacterium]
MKSGDPVEQEKQLKYATLVANTVMLSNVADLTDVHTAMIGDGHAVTAELVGHLSPYIRDHIRRFGRFVLDMEQIPKPLNPAAIPFKTAL